MSKLTYINSDGSRKEYPKNKTSKWNCYICNKEYDLSESYNQRCEWCGRQVCHSCVGKYETIGSRGKYKIYDVTCVKCCDSKTKDQVCYKCSSELLLRFMTKSLSYQCYQLRCALVNLLFSVMALIFEELNFVLYEQCDSCGDFLKEDLND